MRHRSTRRKGVPYVRVVQGYRHLHRVRGEQHAHRLAWCQELIDVHRLVVHDAIERRGNPDGFLVPRMEWTAVAAASIGLGRKIPSIPDGNVPFSALHLPFQQEVVHQSRPSWSRPASRALAERYSHKCGTTSETVVAVACGYLPASPLAPSIRTNVPEPATGASPNRYGCQWRPAPADPG